MVSLLIPLTVIVLVLLLSCWWGNIYGAGKWIIQDKIAIQVNVCFSPFYVKVATRVYLFNIHCTSVYIHLYCCSDAKLYLTFCHPMKCKMPGFPVLHYLPEFTQTHVHWISECQATISSSVTPFSSYPQSFPASGWFSVGHFLLSRWPTY